MKRQEEGIKGRESSLNSILAENPHETSDKGKQNPTNRGTPLSEIRL